VLCAEFVQFPEAAATGQVSEWVCLAVAVDDIAECGVRSLGGVELAVQKLHELRVGAIVSNSLGARVGVRNEDSSRPADARPKS
jgi:hypothetical protein